MNDVEVMLLGEFAQLDPSSHAERQQQRRQRDPRRDELIEVDWVEVRQRVSLEEEVLFFVMVAPVAVRLQVVTDHPVCKRRIWRPGQYMHLVPHPGQFSRQVIEIDTLSAGVHVPLVHDEADLHNVNPYPLIRTGSA